MAGKSSTFQISLKLLTQEFTKGLNNVQKQLKSFGNFVKGAFGLTALATFGRKVIETGAQFEDAMARVQAVSNATASEMAMMTKEAEKLGATTKYTASEAAGALENLTRNGMSASDATATLSTVLKMAQANAIGLSESADIVSNTLNTFGLEAKDAQKVSDVLSATAANSATNISSLNEALVNAAPVANTLGLSLEETTAMIGALAQRGLKGAAAGTQMRMALVKMVDPKVSAALKKYGVDIDESTLKSEGLVGVLKRLADANLNMTQMSEIFKSRQAAGIQQMVDSYKDLVKLIGITENAAGTTARMFEQGVGSTENAIKSLQSAYEGFLNSIFKRTSGVFNSIIKGLTSIVRALSDTKTRTTAIIGTVVSLLSIKLVGAMNKVKAKAIETKVAMTTLQAGITTVTAAAKAAYAAMGGWVGILVTVASLITTKVVNAVQQAKSAEASLSNSIAEATGEINAEATRLGILHDIAKDVNQDIRVRKSALEDLKSAMPDYLGQLNKEGELINDNADAIDKYIEKLLTEAVIERKMTRLKELEAKRQVAINKAKEAAIKAQEGPSWFEKFLGALVTSEQINNADMGYNGPIQGAGANARTVLQNGVEAANEELTNIDNEIKQLREDLKQDIAKAQQLAKDLTGGNGGGGGSGGSSKSTKDTPDEKLFKARQDWDDALQKAASSVASGSAKIEDIQNDVISAYQALIDAYIDYAVETGNNKIFEGEEYQEVLQSFNKLKTSTEDLANLRKGQKDKEEKYKNSLGEMQKSRDRYNAKDAKATNTNPWDNFTSDPREYKKERVALQELEAELDRLQEAYNACKDRVKDVANVNTEEAKDIMKWWNQLGDLIKQKTLEIAEAQNKLGKQEALDRIKDLHEDYVRGIYNSVKTTTSAVNTLTSSLQQIASGDWASMTIADKFSTISNAIFGTIDAVVSAIDSFRTLHDTFEALGLAKKTLNEIETEGDQKRAEAAAAVAAAEMAKAQATVAATELEQGVIDTALEIQRKKVAANSSEAISGSAAAMASIPYVGPALAAAAAEAMAALLAATLPKFASGGVIQGNSKYGDRLLARVNAGEMILNAQQQKRLFDIANGHGGLGAGKVEFVIGNNVLRGVLRSAESANSRISGAKGF